MSQSSYLGFASILAKRFANAQLSSAEISRKLSPNEPGWFFEELKADMFNIAASAIQGKFDEIPAQVDGLELFIREHVGLYDQSQKGKEEHEKSNVLFYVWR